MPHLNGTSHLHLYMCLHIEKEESARWYRDGQSIHDTIHSIAKRTFTNKTTSIRTHSFTSFVPVDCREGRKYLSLSVCCVNRISFLLQYVHIICCHNECISGAVVLCKVALAELWNKCWKDAVIFLASSNDGRNNINALVP